MGEFFCWFGGSEELHSSQGRNFEVEVFSDVVYRVCLPGLSRTVVFHRNCLAPYQPKTETQSVYFRKTLQNSMLFNTL